MPREAPAMLSLGEIRFGYPSRPDFLGPVTLSVQRGQCWAIVGPNGAGKSTLLRLMAGLARPCAGTINLDGTPLADMPGRVRAQRVTFVPQNPPGDLDITVRDMVLMGRFPHRSLGLFESADDFRISDEAMAITATQSFADRPICTLSGGEAQRVHLAAALAQQPQLVLLDEPTASLDIAHQLAIFEILRDRAQSENLSVVVVTHDINLASLFCSNILLLCDGRVVAAGPPDEVLTPQVLGPVYGVVLATLTLPDDPTRRWVVPVTAGRRARA